MGSAPLFGKRAYTQSFLSTEIYIKRKIAERIYLYIRIYRKIKITRHICVFKNTLGYMYIITYENQWAYMRL